MTIPKEFRRKEEQDAYRFLHTHGKDAFEEEYGLVSAPLMLDAWERAGLATFNYVESGTYTDSRGNVHKDYVLKVRTFKKYLHPDYIG